MKSTLTKNKAISNSHSLKPFFTKKGEGSFFSNNQEAEKPFFTTSTIQPKLTIGQQNDKYEKEADAMAEQVAGNSETKIQLGGDQPLLKSISRPFIQRLSSEKSPTLKDGIKVENEQEASAVQALSKPQGRGKEPLISKKQLDANKHGGQKLDASTRSFMETQFRNDFSNVIIHDDVKSEKLASSISARAFAYGNDIYFNRGEYQPESKEGIRTLAHELTHVVQQGGAAQLNSTAPKIQRLGALGRQLQSGIAPWSTPHPVGTNYEVSTDAGSTVTAWVAYSPYTNRLRYWCHGHSLGTYNNSVFGYSVYSGKDMARVIADEWRSISQAQTQSGDIAVWTAGYDHSAKFVNPVITNGQLDPNASTLSTKNGQNALATMTLTAIAGIYGGAGVAVFRHV